MTGRIVIDAASAATCDAGFKIDGLLVDENSAAQATLS